MKPKSTYRAPLALYVWRHLAAALALLPAALAAAVAVGAMGTLATTPALASVASADCPPGSTAPECAAPASPVTASFHGAPETHNGKRLFAFEIRFSRTFDGLRLGPFKRALSVTGGRVVDVKRTVRGENGGVTVRVRPNSSDALTVTLAANTAGGGSLTVPGPSTPPPPPPSTPPQSSPTPTPAPTPPTTPPSPPVAEAPATETPDTETPAQLTASFHGVPEEHDGKKRFSFEIHFSEEFDGLRLTALKRSLLVSGGRVIDVRRTVRGQNRSVTVRVRPSSHDPVIVALPPTLDCTARGAICAKDGRKLSAHASMTVTSPAWGTAPVFGSIDLGRLRSLSENRLRTAAKSTLKTVSSSGPSTSAPPGFPSSDTGSIMNMNGYRVWNDAPNIQLRERGGNSGAVAIDFPCTTSSGPGTASYEAWCRLGVAKGIQRNREDLRGGVGTFGRWFTYPHDAGTNDMKVHLHVRRGASGTGGAKTELSNFFYDVIHEDFQRKSRGDALDYFHNWLDFFKAEAYLETPSANSAVQPTGASGTSATWTGKVVALDSGGRISGRERMPNFGLRGQLVGGDVSASVLFSAGARLNLQLTNLKGANVEGSTYSNRSWSSVVVTNGSFSFTPGDTGQFGPGPLEGTFRQQGTGTSPNTVGGTFSVPANSFGKDGLVGGFVATRN